MEVGTVPTLNDDLSTALEIADRAATLALEFFDGPVQARLKSDGTPVTEADLAVERLLVEELTARRPGDGILSEEGAVRQGRRRWILDPIDGTSNFARADPNWGTHVALQDEQGRLVVGVITRPALGSRWWATREGGAYCNDERSGASAVPLRTSTVSMLAESRASVWPPHPCRMRSAMETAGCWVDPDSTVLMKLLGGELDLLVVRHGDIWDHAPAVLLTLEAGGGFRDPEGGTRLDLRGGFDTNGVIDQELAKLPAW
jgi:histidinol-phosphatase